MQERALLQELQEVGEVPAHFFVDGPHQADLVEGTAAERTLAVVVVDLAGEREWVRDKYVMQCICGLE